MSNHKRTCRKVLPAACVIASLALAGCAAAPTGTGARDQPELALPESKLTWQQSLLDEAFRTASQLPERPHARARARLQEEIANAALDLGMIELALSYGDRIADWRRGEVLALAAQRFARAGDMARARTCMAGALDVAATSTGWTRDRVLTEVAAAHVALGEVDSARTLAAQVPPEDTGRVEAALSGLVKESELDRQADAFDQAIATKNFDLARSGIDGYLAWYARVAKDAARADRAVKAIRAAAPDLPRDLQVTYAVKLADALAAQGHREECNAELAAAALMLAETAFLPEDVGPLTATVARARARHGDAVGARQLLQSALDTYVARHAEIADVFRAGYLRPVAEALAAVGDDSGARACWMMALDAGATNPNAKPRTEDLCRTSLSMVRAGAEPDAATRQRMADIRADLKDPW